MVFQEGTCAEEATDPFAGVDDEGSEGTGDGALDGLVRQLDPEMSASDYVQCDDDIATCSTLENKVNWREEIRDMELSQGFSPKKCRLTESDSEDEDDIVELSNEITTFNETIATGNDMYDKVSHRKRRRRIV